MYIMKSKSHSQWLEFRILFNTDTYLRQQCFDGSKHCWNDYDKIDKFYNKLHLTCLSFRTQIVTEISRFMSYVFEFFYFAIKIFLILPPTQ